jgi:regulator of replication initiation timing
MFCSLCYYFFSFVADYIQLEYSTQLQDGATNLPTSYRASSTMAGQPSGIMQAINDMASAKTYTLDDFVSYALEYSSEYVEGNVSKYPNLEGNVFKYFKNKDEVLSLFDDGHFDKHNIRRTEDTIHADVIQVGSWGHHGEETLWAGRIDDRVIYCHGKSDDTLSTTPNPFLFGYRKHYFKNDREPFCYVDPTKISHLKNDLSKTAEYLDLLVEIFFLRHQLVSKIPDNSKGWRLSYFKNICIILRGGKKHKQTQVSTAVASTTGSTPAVSSASTNPLFPISSLTSDQHLKIRQTFSTYSEQLEQENAFLKAQLADALSRNNTMNAEIEQQKRTIAQVTEANTKVVADAKSNNEAMSAEIGQQKQKIQDLHKEKFRVVAEAQSQNEALIVQQKRKIDELSEEKTNLVTDAQTQKSAMATEIGQHKRKIEELSEEKEEAEKRVKNIVQMYKDGSRAAEEYVAARKE